jgi:hypothetical protein
MNPVWWVLWSGLCVIGSGGLVYFIMQSRMEVLLSKQREELAVLRATLEERRDSMEGSIRNAEESTRRQALDDFLAEIRVEERSYIREHKAFFLSKKSLIRQERIFFRNIPLSSWVEQEMPFEEGADVDKLAQTMAVFNAALLPEVLPEAESGPVRRLLR